ncbi:unnamed protein product [Staurois parvus]|uniref:Uncharacterized protein n=1 Tax=Staurois parvus TaxID=386267 RepID=A0ABN9DEM1_9NEOB|nr:unnamed protein product [Staurois parvus]
MSLFVIFKFPAVPSPIRPDARGGRNPDDRCRHPPDYISVDTAGGTSWERRTRLSDRGIAEQRRMISPIVARGYHLCYTREYRQGG